MKKQILAWLINEERLKRHPFLRRFFWERGPIYRRMAQMAARMRKKEIITVAFMVLDLPCWKCDSVFRLMQTHPRFRPIIWIVPEKQIKDADERQRMLLEMRRFFAERDYQVAELLSLHEMREQYAPDIVFWTKPYWDVTHCEIGEMKNELVCYVPYSYHNTEKGGFQHFVEEYTWYNFFSSAGVKRQARRYMNNGGANVQIVGHPIADGYLFPESNTNRNSAWKTSVQPKLKLIWAPHWTINGESWLSTSCFLDLAEGMLQLVEKYASQVQWAFKPHPLLRDSLYQHPIWGKERTDAYYARWASMPNTQLETGNYEALFKQSDAMIHDSGSFIIEYLLVDKPCMYLANAFSQTVDWNEDTREALKCYHKGCSLKDVEQFIVNLLAHQPDSLAMARAKYKKRYLFPPHRVSAAQNIINTILKSR